MSDMDVEVEVKIEPDDEDEPFPFNGSDADGSSSPQESDEEDEDAPDYSTRGHDWIADQYFDIVESGARPGTPESIATDTDTSDDAEQPAPADVASILRHVVYRLLRDVVCAGRSASEDYDPTLACGVWVCPMRGCGHTVDPLELDLDARLAVSKVFGELGTSVVPWTGKTVLGKTIERDNNDLPRVVMSLEEIRHRRTGMELIAWKHIQKYHLAVYGVQQRDLGCIDANSGVRGVVFERTGSREALFAYAPAILITSDEEHRFQLAEIRANEIRRLESERHKMRVLLTHWHRRQNRFLDQAVAYCKNTLPHRGHNPSNRSGRIIMAGLDRLREECEPDFARARLTVVNECLRAWRDWDLLSRPVPKVLA